MSSSRNPHFSTRHSHLVVALTPRLDPFLEFILSGRAAKSSPFQEAPPGHLYPSIYAGKLTRGTSTKRSVHQTTSGRPYPHPRSRLSIPASSLLGSTIVHRENQRLTPSPQLPISSSASAYSSRRATTSPPSFPISTNASRGLLARETRCIVLSAPEAPMTSLADHAGALFSRHADQAGALLSKRRYCSDGTYRHCCSRWDCFGRWIFAAVAVFVCFLIFFLWA